MKGEKCREDDLYCRLNCTMVRKATPGMTVLHPYVQEALLWLSGCLTYYSWGACIPIGSIWLPRVQVSLLSHLIDCSNLPWDYINVTFCVPNSFLLCLKRVQVEPLESSAKWIPAQSMSMLLDDQSNHLGKATCKITLLFLANQVCWDFWRFGVFFF